MNKLALLTIEANAFSQHKQAIVCINQQTSGVSANLGFDIP